MGLWCDGFSLERVNVLNRYFSKVLSEMAREEAEGQTWDLDSVSSEICFASCPTKWSFSCLFVGYPTAYPAAAPAYNPSLYPTNSPSYAPGKEKVEIIVVSGIGGGIY